MAAPPRPYRRILTSALHRRFVHASALTLLMDYIVSFVIGTKTSFLWSWFPLGTCGLRALLLFISTLAVFFIRVTQMHVGPRTTASPLAALRAIFPLQIVQTLGWYLFSAWWFSEVYLWSAPEEADLGWVKIGRLNSRPTLNERSIYLHTYHMMLAVAQTAIHLYCDYDRLPIPVVKRTSQDERTHPVEPVFKRLQYGVVASVIDALRNGFIITLASPFIYVIFLRRSAWNFSLYFAKLFWNFSRNAAEPQGAVPPAFHSLFFRQIISGGCLVFLWQTANLFFTVFLTQEPLKRGQPLTNYSKDPTGSLINGLKAKKDIVKNFAFWELCFISQRFPDRRKAIFEDLERSDGGAWKQVLQASVNTIDAINNRINKFKSPPTKTNTKSTDVAYPQIQSLPQLTEGPKQDNIFAPSPKGTGFGQSVGATAKSFGQSKDWTPIARAKAKEAFTHASDALLSPERKKKLLGASNEVKLLTGPAGTSQSFNFASIPFVSQFLRSPIGKPFRQTFAQRLRGIVFGEPHGQVACIIDAIEATTRLLIASLAEDSFGQVFKDLPTIIRLYTSTIITLEDFVHEDTGLNIHWSDVTFPSANSSPEVRRNARTVPEVDIVLHMLRTSLSELLASFEKYSRDVGLQAKDIRLAKVAVGLIDDHNDNDDPFTS
ncbi:nuclear envelope protein, putative [Talaromyces stipitatus ATCC 10500]|uniref:Nuclear envelope protein, putative n=1 Tax=Talaromyces stipitatus (strain ATCC 10500 / CBS 375.48 / QM 6759 / NRRL 1006) TaxID=441959 RepID=B8LUI9_TALSN|nr:nuclear envelope protein, putative [Talaromyces stipitatus ATCC 10500]EED23762.1 nuclear envelope protein, putative [Talaromyces stipitatus ATCC 10500]